MCQNLECGWLFKSNRTDCGGRGGTIVQVDFQKFNTETLFDYITM